MIREIKKDWKFFVVLAIAIIAIWMLAIYTVTINQKLYTKGSLPETVGSLQDISENTQIEQKFIAKENNLEKIKIEFEPYKEDSNVGGKVKIGIRNEQGNILKEKEITRNYVRDNTSYELKFQKQKNSQDKVYTIYIEFEDLHQNDKFYTVKYAENNEENIGDFIVNGKIQKGNQLVFQEYYKSPTRTLIFIGILLVMTILVLILATIIYYKKNIKAEKLFLMTVPIVCLFFLITMPTFKNHDEYYHWLKAYEISTGNLMTPIENNIQGSMMPEGVSKVFPNSEWINMDYKMVQEKLEVTLEKDKQGILNPETAALYSFIQYIPQATGIALARLVTDNVYLITYAGRLVNLLVALILLYFAIKIIPFGKKLILIPAMIPIALEGFTSLSPDAMTISMAFLYLAYILNLAFGEKQQINWKDKFLLLLMSIVIALCKIVYIPLVGLILLIPKEKFKGGTNKSKILNFIVIAGIALAVNLLWLGISSKYLSNFREGDSQIQVALLFQNPIQYIQELLYTINLYGNNYVMSLFGMEIGWGELVKIHSIVPYVLMGIYLLVAITDNDIKNKFKIYQLVWMVLVVLAIVALIFTSLYVQWTTVGSFSIEGVQGRYFLPILPLIMFLLGSTIKVKSSYSEEGMNKFVVISILVLQIYTVSQIIVTHL